MSALTRGEELVIPPNPDRTIFKSRDPPMINHPHHEYLRPTRERSPPQCQTHMIHLSWDQVAKMKNNVLREGMLGSCSTFEVVAAKIWKARSIAVEMEEEKISTILFPVDVRKRVVPKAPVGFAGNALIPGFARASVRELKGEEDYVLVKRVQQGVERLDDEYVRSSIDWLEVNKGGPWMNDSFSLVAWSRLGLEEDEYVWGKIKRTTPVVVKPNLVYVLPGTKDEGGLNICLQLPDDQTEEFRKLMMEG